MPLRFRSVIPFSECCIAGSWWTGTGDCCERNFMCTFEPEIKHLIIAANGSQCFFWGTVRVTTHNLCHFLVSADKNIIYLVVEVPDVIPFAKIFDFIVLKSEEAQGIRSYICSLDSIADSVISVSGYKIQSFSGSVKSAASDGVSIGIIYAVSAVGKI